MEKYIQSKSEKSFFDAAAFPAIINGGEQAQLHLIDLLAKWRFMAGVTTVNEEEAAQELFIIQAFVTENYGDKLNLKQIEHAMNLSLTESLEVETRAFNVFSPAYVARILNAYIREQINVFKNLKARHEVDYSLIEQPKPDPNKMAEEMKEIIKSVYQRFQSEGVVYDAFSYLYNYFKKKGLLDLSKDAVDAAVKYGDMMMLKTAENEKGWFGSGMLPVNRDGLRKSYSRAFVVQKLFEKINLDDLLLYVKSSDFDGHNG